MRILFAAVSIFLVFLSPVFATQLPDTDTIPKSLEPWKSWVLHGEEGRFCPTSFNNGEQYRCVWPSRLDLNLTRKSGRFVQDYSVFVKGWVALPVAEKNWPLNVKVDGKTATVMQNKNIPLVYMIPGKHRVEGAFVWDDMPEMIRVPESCGLINLTINQTRVDFPLWDSQGRLWLQKREATAQEDRLEVKTYRLFNDTIPMRTTTLLKVNISGRAREIPIDGVLPEKFIPLNIESPVPARFSPEGTLLIQGRAGRWEIRIHARSEGPVGVVQAHDIPGREIWSFQSQNHLRMVKVSGVPSVDPTQTDIPDAWKKFPAFIVKAGDRMALKEIRRGDPEPAPDQIHLKRTWWLDFGGGGFTVQDQITGTMSSQWYLAMNPPAILGRVTVDGRDQLITGHGKDEKPGVELRKGRLNLVAESRFEKSTLQIPAVGWDHDFQSVSGQLNLPPGWRLFSATGVDTIPGTWFSQWTLLDLFLVLIISLSIYKLWNWRWGLLGLVVLGLIYHEPGAPKVVWLNILAAIALLRVLPPGWIRKLVNLWCLVSLVCLVVMAVPFMVHQVRWGIYPQLEPHTFGTWPVPTRHVQDIAGDMEDSALPRAPAKELRAQKAIPESKSYAGYLTPSKRKTEADKQALLMQDPNALIQTGPGLPRWQWKSHRMAWNGPVEKSQQVRLHLLGPTLNLVLALLRVILLMALVVKVAGFRKWTMVKGTLSAEAFCLFVLMLPSMTLAGETAPAYPPETLLQQLKERLLEKPDCLPNCADSPQMKLTVRPDGITILFKIHAAVETAVPLPGSLESWRPDQVILDEKPSAALMRDRNGSLWILVPKGIHTITMVAGVPSEHSFQIVLPLKPQKVVVESEGWDVQGVSKEGRVEASIHLIRQEKEETDYSIQSAGTLPPFLHVERILSLGLNWQVRTKVRRLTPPGTPIVISIPLIEGESVTTAHVMVENGMAQLNMGPDDEEIRWNGTLKTSNLITLQAPQSGPWTETWLLDASPIWHCECKGIPVVHHQDKSGLRQPQWAPWPGEKVFITVSRPKALPGQVVTIDAAGLTLTPGQRFDQANLALTIRSSQGGQHKIELPKGAKLQWVQIDGKTQPIKAQDHMLMVPLHPGSQEIQMEWHQKAVASPLTTAPTVFVGRQAVNADVIFQMPGNRWVLFTQGPVLGPAVRFWSYLLVVVIVAVLLGRISWTPLKTSHWLLLGLGLTQVPPLAAVMIVGWLLVLGIREKYPYPAGWFAFNSGQILLVIWTFAALIGLYFAIQNGLLGIPDMQISGNGSSNSWLHWTQDRIDGLMPAPTVLSLPLFVYRILMLLWALWLAYSLLKWLRWAWHCFSSGGLWRKMRLHRQKQEQGEKV